MGCEWSHPLQLPKILPIPQPLRGQGFSSSSAEVSCERTGDQWGWLEFHSVFLHLKVPLPTTQGCAGRGTMDNQYSMSWMARSVHSHPYFVLQVVNNSAASLAGTQVKCHVGMSTASQTDGPCSGRVPLRGENSSKTLQLSTPRDGR